MLSSCARRLWWFPLLVLAAGLPAGAAMLPFTGRLDVVFGQVPFFVTVDGTGVASVNGNGLGGPLTSLGLPAGVFHATALNFPGTQGIGQIRVTAANGAGNFALTPNGGGGAMPLPGVVRLCLLATCDAAANQLLLPLDPVGAGGTAMVTGPVTLTVTGMLWTQGLVVITTPGAVTSLEGFAHGPLSNTGTTAQLGGVLELVTPAVVHTTIPGLNTLKGYALLHVEFIPEPASAALAGLGLALFGVGGWRRRATRRTARQ